VRTVAGDHDSIVQGKKAPDTIKIINEIINGPSQNHVDAPPASK
jgi:hypothetical protein